MIDDEADFNNILDASEEVQTAAKFCPKQRAKLRKVTVSSRSAVPIPTVEPRDGKVGALTQVSPCKEFTSQGSGSVDDIDGSLPDTTLEDVLTVPLGPLGGASAVDRISQDDEHNDDSSKLDTHQESLVASDIHVLPATSCGKTIDDVVDFGEMFDAQAKEERVAKFQPKVQVKRLNAAAKSKKTNHKVEASTVDVVTQNERGDNIQTSDSEGLLANDDSTLGNLPILDSVLEEPFQEETTAKLCPKLQPKPGKASPKVFGTTDNVAVATPMVGICADNSDMWTKSKDHETITGPANWSLEDVQAAVDLDYHNDLTNPPTDGTESTVEQVLAEPVKSQPNVGREKSKEKSVSFALPDASGGVTPTTNSEMGNFSNSCNGKVTGKELSNSSQLTAEKQSISEQQYASDQEYTDNECQYHEGEPLDDVTEQPKSNVGEVGSSMNLRSRKKLPEVGTPKDTADDYFDEDRVEPSLDDNDNDSGDNYTVGAKGKVRKKSRQEPQQQKIQKDKSQGSSRGHKRTLKDKLSEKPEKKKLTHRIRQRRTNEVKILLETPLEEIDPMKLSAAHLRLLQEARERVNAKEIPSGPSSNTSFQFEDMDDFDYRDEEARNFDNDRTQNHVQNTTKLNYHSYMNKQTRAKWTKSDTDLFYQGLRQFGSDFAMIQQLFPDKTRHQVRQKFKTEEKKNPLQVHDAIIHRSGDNLYFKKVIKQLNIEDVVPDINSTQKQDGASSKGGPGNENVLDDFTNEEENDSNCLAEEPGTHMPDVQEEEHVSGNDDDDLGAVFDWY